MTGFGLWEPYIELEHIDWYALSPSLKTALEGYEPNGTELEPMTDADFERKLMESMQRAAKSVKDRPVRYHTGEHFSEVVLDGMALLETYETLTGVQLPVLVKQTFALACADHDFGHPGATFRSFAPRGNVRADLGLNCTVEEVSAIIGDAYAMYMGLNPFARLAKTVWIWSTTFGASAPRGVELNLGRIQPTSFLELAIGLADIAPNDKFARKLAKGVDVTFRERPATPPPDTFGGWFVGRLAFCRFTLGKMQALNAAAGVDVTGHLGWTQNLQHIVTRLEAARDGRNIIDRAFLMAQVAEFVDISR